VHQTTAIHVAAHLQWHSCKLLYNERMLIFNISLQHVLTHLQVSLMYAWGWSTLEVMYCKKASALYHPKVLLNHPRTRLMR
jgi:hypothetical protein